MSHIVAITAQSEALGGLRDAVLAKRHDASWTAVPSIDEVLGEHDAGPADVVVFDGIGADTIAGLARLWAASPRLGVVLRDPSAADGVARTATGALTWLGTDADADAVGTAVDAILERRDGADRLDAMSLDDMLTLAVATGWSGGLAVRNGARSGRIEFDGGRPARARFSDHAGHAALVEMLALPSGTLVVVPLGDATCEDLGDVDLIAVRDEAATLRRERDEAAPVDITDEDLELFMGVTGEAPAPSTAGDAFQLFSDDELAELQLDDAMAVSLPRPDGRPATRPAIPTLRPTTPPSSTAYVHLDATGTSLTAAPGGADAAMIRAIAALGRALGGGPGGFVRASADLGDARFAALGLGAEGDVRALIDTEGRWTVELFDLLHAPTEPTS